VYSRHRRKARFLFGLSDVLLAVLAFQAAYWTRSALPLERVFYFTLPVKALLLGFTALVWPAIGLWLGVYDKLDAGVPASSCAMRCGRARWERPPSSCSSTCCDWT
jgi:hypothetical protein